MVGKRRGKRRERIAVDVQRDLIALGDKRQMTPRPGRDRGAIAAALGAAGVRHLGERHAVVEADDQIRSALRTGRTAPPAVALRSS